MAVSRYWRLVGIATPGNGVLELSEARLYQAGALADASATLTSTIAPASGALTDLRDGLANGVVSWPYASYSQPGFALLWDFGTGGGVEFPALRLGSGGSAATFPADLMVQSSVDGINWTFLASAISVVYPGDHALTSLPTADVDPYQSSVVLHLHANGASGSTSIVDSSPNPKSVTAVGNAQISTAQSKFGGASLALDGNGDYLTIPYSPDFDISPTDFTIRLYLFILGNSATDSSGERVASLISANVPSSGLTKNAWELALRGSGSVTGTGLEFSVNDASGSSKKVAAAYAFALMTWYRVSVVRTASAGVDLYVNNTKLTKQTDTLLLTSQSLGAANPIKIGATGYGGYLHYLFGYLDEIQITKGVARDIAEPGGEFPDGKIIQVTAPAPFRSRQIAPTPERLFPAADLPATTAHGHLREFPFFDVFNGGIGLITGTVKEKSLPSNAPLARKVWLMDEASGMVVRETWSDATTGTYEFRGVKQGGKYTVLAYDYTHTYRAVVADNLETT